MDRNNLGAFSLIYYEFICIFIIPVNKHNKHNNKRRQFVSINGHNSNPQLINTGVPQGSVLGPLLFIIYVNDIASSVHHSKINVYVDDTAIFYSALSIYDVHKYLKEDMVSISIWLKCNKFSIIKFTKKLLA